MVVPVSSCCASKQMNNVEAKQTKKDLLKKRILPIVELVCKVALGIFSAVVFFKAFIIAISVGIAVGTAYTIYKNIRKEPIEIGLSRPSCGVGFFDYLSGIRYPAIVSSVITAVFVGIHLHCSPLYVAFCMVPLGIFVGTQLTQISWNLTYRAVYAVTTPPIKNIQDVFSPAPGMMCKKV